MHHQNKILILAFLSIMISVSAQGQTPSDAPTKMPETASGRLARRRPLLLIQRCYSLRRYVRKPLTSTRLSSLRRRGTL